MRAAELLGAGSILDSWSRARARTRLAHHLTLARPRDLHVWGTGLMLPREPKWPQRLHVHAVRGELTAQKAGVNTVLGDPGILASLLVEKPKDKQLSVGFVPHYVDFDLGRSLQVPSDWKVINPEWPVDEVLSSIAGSELIVSSSLHGLITADSFGIPCVWLGTSNPLHGASDFKFRDYETSRRASLNEPLTYDQIVKMDATQISTIATRPDRSIETWQKELIEAFPFR
jgi:hypothetical protein